MSVVREDEHGLYLQVSGRKRRPGAVIGHAHALDMSTGGLKAGDKVNARHVSGSALCRIVLAEGRELHWSDHTAYPPGYVSPVKADSCSDGPSP